MDITVGTLKAFFVLDDQFSSKFQVALRNIDQGSAKVQALGTKFEDVGQKLSLRLTAPIVGVAAAALTAGTAFERTMNQVGAVTNASTADLTKLRDAATEWGAKTKYSADEAGQAMLELGKAGFDTTSTIAALPSTLELATAAGLSLADAASLTANTMKTFKLETTDLAHANDVLAAAALSSTIDVTDLRETLKYGGPVAAATGVKLSEVSAAASIMGTAGIKGSMAGTSLRSALTELLNPGEKARHMLTQLGFGSDLAAGKTIQLADVLDKLHSRADKASLAMEAFGDRGGVGMIALAEAGGAALRKLSNDLDQSEGAAKRMADATMKGLPGAIETFKGSVETASTKLLEVLQPAFVRILELGTRAADLFTNQLVPAFMALPEPVQLGTIAIVAFAASIGPALIALGSLMRVAGMATDAVKLLAGSQAAQAAIGAFRNWSLVLPMLSQGLLNLSSVAGNLGNVAGPIGLLAQRVSMLSGSAAAAVPTAAGFAAALGPVAIAVTALGAAAYYTWNEIDKMKRKQAEAAEQAKKDREKYVIFDPTARPTSAFEDSLLRMGLDQAKAGFDPAPTSGDGLNKLAEATKKLKEAQADLIIQARAYAAFAGTDLAKMPIQIQRDYYDALHGVIESFGSLKAAGLDSLTGIYNQLDRVVGKFADWREEADKTFRGNIRSTTEGLSWLPEGPPILRDQFATQPVEQDWRFSTRFGNPWMRRVTQTGPGGLQNLLQGSGVPSLSFNQAFSAPPMSLSQRVFGMSTQQIGTGLSATVMQAVTGGGNVGQAAGQFLGQSIANRMTEAIGKQTTGFFTSGLGKVIGGAVPFVGPLLAPLAGKLAGAVVGLFTGGEGAKANKLRDDLKAKLADAVKGLENDPALQGYLDAFNRAGTQKDVQLFFDQAAQSAQKARDLMAKYGLSLDELKPAHEKLRDTMVLIGDEYTRLKGLGFGDERLAKAMASPLNDILRGALETGQKIPKAIEPLLISLARGGGLADDLVRKMLGMSEKVRVNWQDLAAAAARYNIEESKLGTGFQESRLFDLVKELADDWKLLNIPGAETNAILEKMAPKAQEVLNNYLKWGIEIPPQMRPLLQALLDAGLLTDSAGNKLETLDGLNFGEDLTDRIEDLVAAIQKLVDALNDVPSAADRAGRATGRNNPSPEPDPNDPGHVDADGNGYYDDNNLPVGQYDNPAAGAGYSSPASRSMRGRATPSTSSIPDTIGSFARASSGSTKKVSITVVTPDADGMRRLVRGRAFKQQVLDLLRDDGAFRAEMADTLGVA